MVKNGVSLRFNQSFRCLHGGGIMKNKKHCQVILMGLLFVYSLIALASIVYADPAVVIAPGSCAFVDGDRGGFTTSDVKQVYSINGNGDDLMLECQGASVPNSTGKAVHWDFGSTGIACHTAFGSTNVWNSTIDAQGNGVLSCRIF